MKEDRTKEAEKRNIASHLVFLTKRLASIK